MISPISSKAGNSDVAFHEVVTLVCEGSKCEAFNPIKLLLSLQNLASDLDAEHLKLHETVQAIQTGLPDKISMAELNDLICDSLAARVIHHPDYALLAGRVEVLRLHEIVPDSFSDNVNLLSEYVDPVSRKKMPLVSEELIRIVSNSLEFYDSLIKKERDFNLPIFGIKTLAKNYLLTRNGVPSETPQYLFLRVAIGIHGDDTDAVVETYDLMSLRYFIHASPTLFNAGTQQNYLSSCFLVAMNDDSIDGIYKTLHKTALISKAAGGVGLHVHNIRASGARIAGSHGRSSGLVPMLRVFNDTARYVDQGGNKRPGAFAIYIEPWHADIFDVLHLKKNHGKEEWRTRDLFFGLWVPDLFMKRVKHDSKWSLFSPDEAPGLSDCHGEEFVKLYEKYEKQGVARVQIQAQKLWLAIIESQTETGGPYMLFKDTCNAKSNQKNLGTIKSSNLCCEIVEYSSPEETAVCNLASLALPSFVIRKDSVACFDFAKLHDVTEVITRNLNKVIDVTKYPLESSKKSNLRHRPIAIGVQGLADLFCDLRIPFTSPEAKELNIQIFETIYHAALTASVSLARKDGPYESFDGSPASKGILQFHMWNHTPSKLFDDWDLLIESVKKYGVRNSLLVAPMPTASTSQILGFSECFEPYTSNIYTRRVLSGEFQVVNENLVRDLIDLGLWTRQIIDSILVANGSIQQIDLIPGSVKELYKTVWEIPQKVIIDMAADRGKFIDQLQSMNVYLRNPTIGKLTSCHFYAWEKGLKTGMYYLRTQAASRPTQFTVELDQVTPTSVRIKDLKRARYEPISRGLDGTDSTKRPKIPIYKTPDSLQSRSPLVRALEELATETPTETYDIYSESAITCTFEDAQGCLSCSG